MAYHPFPTNQRAMAGLGHAHAARAGQYYYQTDVPIRWGYPRGLGSAPTLSLAQHDDQIQIKNSKAQILATVEGPPTPNCGAPTRGHCYQRMVLILLGWLDQSLYSTSGSVGVSAIKRLQGAVGVTADGDWGPETNDNLAGVLGLADDRRLANTRKGGSVSPPVSPSPPENGDVVPFVAGVGTGAGGAGLALVLAGLVMWAMKSKG